MNFSQSTEPVTFNTARTLPEITDTHIEDLDSIIKKYREYLHEKTQNHLGYPYNLDFDYRELTNLVEFSINNLGDPFIESNYGVHSRMFEVAVLDWFAQLWSISKEDYWGYITCCGTEGNLHGIYLGRENLPNGILYASQDSHYSIFKAARLYRMECEKVSSISNGTIDLVDLEYRLKKNRGRPAIINVNIGTTLKGGIDDLDHIILLLKECGYSEKDFYIHCDGALVGMMIGFLQENYISFSSKPIGSVSVSGHKFIGSPFPCGVILTRISHMKAIANNIDYINSRDATLMGSRGGMPSILLWYTLVKKGMEGIKQDVLSCITNAEYLCRRLKENGVGNILLNKWSNTVVFPKPKNEEIIRKWQLACSEDVCHIVVMPNVTVSKLEEFIEDYLKV